MVPVLSAGELEPDQTYSAPCCCGFQTIGVVDGYDNVETHIDFATVCDEHILWLRGHYPALMEKIGFPVPGSDAARDASLTLITLLFGKGLVSFFNEYIPSK
jgi:hypothetical protein